MHQVYFDDFAQSFAMLEYDYVVHPTHLSNQSSQLYNGFVQYYTRNILYKSSRFWFHRSQIAYKIVNLSLLYFSHANWQSHFEKQFGRRPYGWRHG